MITIKCQVCGKEKQIKPSYAKRAKFCSVFCYQNDPNSSCYKKGHPDTKGGFKKGHLPHNTGKTHLIKEKNPSWKGGRWVGKYVYILQPEHPFADKHGYVAEHRLVAERYLRRYLTKQERIHHINQNRHDNRPSNLYLFQSTGEHLRYHFSKNSKPITESNLNSHYAA